jgi:hypothetical protein
MIRKAIIVVLTLAAIGTGLLWVGSYRIWSWHAWTFPLKDGGKLNAWGIPGSASFGIWEPVENPVGDWSSHHGWGLDPWELPGWDNFSLKWGEHAGGRFWIVRCAYWLPFIAFVFYPTIAFVRGPLRRHRRRKRGLCLKCGYDLTGNVTGVCPECGAEISK